MPTPPPADEAHDNSKLGIEDSELSSLSLSLRTLHKIWMAIWQNFQQEQGGIPCLMSGNTVINDRSLQLRLGSVAIIDHV